MSTVTSTVTSGLLLWALPGLPAVVGSVLCLLRPRTARTASAISVLSAAVTLVLAVVALIGRAGVQVPFLLGSQFGLKVDGLAGVVVVTVAAVALLVLVFAAADVRVAQGRFHGLMQLFVAAVMVTALATTLPTLLLAWEIMGATSFALIGFAWREPAKMPAARVAFVTTRAADLGLYVAAGAALAAGTGMGLADLSGAGPALRTVVAVGISVAALGKAAQLPFSFWLARAMEGPSPVSALLHSAAMVAMGGFLLLRVEGLLAATGWVATAVAWVGALTALLLGVVAIAQRDLKQLLAASTAAQLGFVVLAAGVGGPAAGVTQLVAHAATKALLFLVAGVWLSMLGTKQLGELRGVGRRWRGVGAAATVGLLALAGVAPLSLWASKEAVLAVTRDRSGALYAVGVVAAALSAGYAGKVLAVIWAPLPDEARADRSVSRAGGAVAPAMRLPLAVLAAAAASLGLLVVPPVAGWLHAALGDTLAMSLGALELVGSAALALFVLAAVWRWPVPEPSWATSWLGLEAAAQHLVVRPTHQLAHRLAWFDDRVVDHAVDVVAARCLALARHARRLDEAGIDAAVLGAAHGIRRVGQLARRPQTGRLHEYYLQSVVVLAAAALLLVLVR